MTLSVPDGTAVISCQPLTYLLRAATWQDRRLHFNVSGINIPTYLSISTLDPRVLQGLDDNWTFPKWWLWPGDGPVDGK